MDIIQLKQFLDMTETLNFGKSSRNTALSPSAFTRSIKRLEDELGYELFHRNNRHTTLTPAGELFRHFAQDIIEKITDFKSIAALNEDNLKGEISIFCTVTASYSILLPIIKVFRETYPDIHIKLKTGDASNTLQKVLDNEVDISISVMPDKFPDSINFYPVTVTPLIFIAPDFNTKFIDKKNNNVNFESMPLILPEKGVARDRINNYFAIKKIRPEVYAQVSGNEAILAMVSLGCGIGLVPKLVVDKSPLKASLRILKFDSLLEPYHVGLCIKKTKESNPFIKAFKNTALENVRVKV